MLPATAGAGGVGPGASTASGAARATASPLKAGGGVVVPTVQTVQPLRTAIGLIPNPQVGQALMTLVDAAGEDISKARENIENWFDSGMDRISGLYKRRLLWITFFVGPAITTLLMPIVSILVKASPPTSPCVML